jgi:integrase
VGASGPDGERPSAANAARLALEWRLVRLHETSVGTRLRADFAKEEPKMSYRADRNASAVGSAELTRRNRQQPRTEARLRSALGPPPHRGGTRRSWKRALQEILWTHNDRHATKPKSVSFKTQAERAAGLFRCFRDLHALGYKIRNPYCLGGRHVRALVEDWTAGEPRARRRTLSPSMVQTELSYLRTLASWIGKPGMVLPAEAYVADPALVTRRAVTTEDRSWPAHGVDPEDLLEEIAAHDPWVGEELRLARAFGLRVKEAVMIQPRLAEQPAGEGANPSGSLGGVLEVTRGTKGGRLRRIPIDTPAKREALDAAKALVRSDSHFLADPTRTLVQNLNRLTNVMKKFGVTHEALGVTPHGLRHEYAGNRYEAVSGVLPPVRGGAPTEATTDAGARLQVAEELGHARTQITSAYLGRAKAGRVFRPASGPDPAEDSSA